MSPFGRLLAHLVHLMTLVVAIAGFAWGLVQMARPAMVIVSEATPSVAHPHSSAPGAALPEAWLHRTLPPPDSPTPTSEGARASPLPTPSPTPSASPTSAPSATPTTTPSPTPIHAPADRDPTRISVPAIGLDAPIVPVRVKEQYNKGVLTRIWAVADYAAGFHQGTARPGHAGNTVISGHNNIRGQVFRDLHKLRPGDEVLVWVGQGAYRYHVAFTVRLPLKGAPPEILDDNLRWIQPTDDQRLTLVTCWPPWSNTHRTIVVAFPAPWEGG